MTRTQANLMAALLYALAVVIFCSTNDERHAFRNSLHEENLAYALQNEFLGFALYASTLRLASAVVLIVRAYDLEKTLPRLDGTEQ